MVLWEDAVVQYHVKVLWCHGKKGCRTVGMLEEIKEMRWCYGKMLWYHGKKMLCNGKMYWCHGRMFWCQGKMMW